MHNAGWLGLVHWDDPEGWYGEGGGRRVQDGFSLKKKKKRNVTQYGKTFKESKMYVFSKRKEEWKTILKK